MLDLLLFHSAQDRYCAVGLQLVLVCTGMGMRDFPVPVVSCFIIPTTSPWVHLQEMSLNQAPGQIRQDLI